jgi:hypothetical protein
MRPHALRTHPHSFTLGGSAARRMVNSARQHSFYRRSIPLSHSTTTIIIVCAVVGGVLFVLLLWRITASRASRSRSAPLPPPQPLAHHREHQLSQFVEHKHAQDEQHFRMGTWLTSNSSMTSAASLLPTDPSSSASHEASSLAQRSTPFSNEPLQAPQPSYFNSHPRAASDSPSAGTHSSDPSPYSSPAPSPRSSSMRHISPTTPSSSHHSPSRVSSSNSHTRRSPSRPRSSRFSGSPHHPNNNVQIMLPAPLAPQLYQHTVGAEDSWSRPILVAERQQNARMSDIWTGFTVGVSENAQAPIVGTTTKRGRDSSSRYFLPRL